MLNAQEKVFPKAVMTHEVIASGASAGIKSGRPAGAGADKHRVEEKKTGLKGGAPHSLFGEPAPYMGPVPLSHSHSSSQFTKPRA